MDGMMCQECGASFQNESKMRIHMRVSHNETISSCKICDEVFEGKKKLYNHMRVHQEEPCKFCFKKIPKNAMRAHLAVCENNEEKKSFSCDQCRICNLKSHTESVHKEEKEPKENKVTIETKRKLTSEKHECGVCGKLFSHQFTLTVCITSNFSSDEAEVALLILSKIFIHFINFFN